jgi:hypothetical protein
MTSRRVQPESNEISLAMRDASTAIRTHSSVGSAASLAWSQTSSRVARSSGIQEVVGSSPGRNGADVKDGEDGAHSAGAGSVLARTRRSGRRSRMSMLRFTELLFAAGARAPAPGASLH